MKNKVLVIALALVLVFSCTAAAFADSGDCGVMPLDTGAVSFTINRTSGTTAYVAVGVSFTDQADEYNVVVYLQKNVNGTWKNDNTNSEYVFYNNGFNSGDCLFEHNYTHLTYGTTYRIMVVSIDKYDDGTQYRNTTYSNAF